jgi:hypothetical protein
VRSDGLSHGAHEVLELHIEQRCALDVLVGGGVEADIDAAAGRGDSARVPPDRRSVEDVDACDMGRAALGSDALGDRVEGQFVAAGEMHVGALARVRARATADPIAPLAP